MPTTRFTVHTRLSPSEVMTLLTDFGPDRPSRRPNIDEAHYAVHDQGEAGPRLPEETSTGWERGAILLGRRGRHGHRGHPRVEPLGTRQPLALRAHGALGLN